MVKISIDTTYIVKAIDPEAVMLAITDYIEIHLAKKNVLVDLIFASQQKVAALNKKYRNKPKTTDVLSFPLWDSKKDILASDQEEINLGSIIINAKLVTKQADYSNRTATEECIFLAKHSVDHLLGKHHKEQELL